MLHNGNTIQVVIADDSANFIEGLKFFLETQLNCTVIGTASNSDELVRHPLLPLADILLIDCEMPIMNGIVAAKQIYRKLPHMLMIAITMYEEQVYLKEIIEAGFKGYVHKTKIDSKLESVMQKVLNHTNNIFKLAI